MLRIFSSCSRTPRDADADRHGGRRAGMRMKAPPDASSACRLSVARIQQVFESSARDLQRTDPARSRLRHHQPAAASHHSPFTQPFAALMRQSHSVRESPTDLLMRLASLIALPSLHQSRTFTISPPLSPLHLSLAALSSSNPIYLPFLLSTHPSFSLITPSSSSNLNIQITSNHT